MTRKVFPPRFFEGREFEIWIRNVSTQIGVDPPATLDELGQESVVPILSKLRALESEIETLKRMISRHSDNTQELKRRITDIEISI